MKKRNLAIAVLLSMGVLVLNLGHGLAATGSMSLSPSGASVTVGSNLTIAIYETADSANVVTANLSYDASKLQCNGVGGGSFSTNVITPTCGGGSVRITRSVAPGSPALAGTNLIGTVSFTGLSAGATSVSFAAGSRIVNEGAEVPSSKSGGSYTVVAAPVTTTPGGKGAGTPANTPTNKTTPTASTIKVTANATSSPTATPTTEATTVNNPETSSTSTDKPTNDGDVKAVSITKEHAWYAFAVVDGNKPLTAARYGVMVAALIGLSTVAAIFVKRTWFAPNTTPVKKTPKTVKKVIKKK